MSLFLETGRRSDGRPFTVERWLAEGIALVRYRGGLLQAVALDAREQQSLELARVEGADALDAGRLAA